MNAWTRRHFVGTFRKFRNRGAQREALFSEIEDRTGKIRIEWCWIPCPPELAHVCVVPGIQVAFDADHRRYPDGIDTPSGVVIFDKLRNAGRPMHMKARREEEKHAV